MFSFDDPWPTSGHLPDSGDFQYANTQQLAYSYLLATALKYFKYAEYTEFSSLLLFDPSSENFGFKICIRAFRVNVVWVGLKKCTREGNTLPICKTIWKDDSKQIISSVNSYCLIQSTSTTLPYTFIQQLIWWNYIPVYTYILFGLIPEEVLFLNNTNIITVKFWL